MNVFKAYKACVPIAWSPNLYITLVRGIPGTRRLHRRTLEALRLRKCNRTVMRWNTPTVRGMLQQVVFCPNYLHLSPAIGPSCSNSNCWVANEHLRQVKRLVVIETEEMYKARKEKEANHKALRPPLVIGHLSGSSWKQWRSFRWWGPCFTSMFLTVLHLASVDWCDEMAFWCS